MKLKEAYERELAMQKKNYDLALAQAVELLEGYRHRAPSTHVGHNLAARAIALAEAAIRVEAAEIALRSIAQAENE